MFQSTSLSAENIVLGSGPAAVMCATALLEKGAKVTMIDPGEKLESSRLALIKKTQAQNSKQEWSSELEKVLRAQTLLFAGKNKVSGLLSKAAKH